MTSVAVEPGAQAARGPAPLGAIPYVAFAIAAGLALVAFADALSRTGQSGGQAAFWAGVLLIVVPAALRLAGPDAGPGERATLVVLAGLALYGVKLLRDPFDFTFADELAHLRNVQNILHSGNLFEPNSILPVTPHFPGLESLASALVDLSGLSPFWAGVLLIGFARVLVPLALLLAFTRISGSARAGSLGALAYAATPTFLYFAAQFSYASLAVPLMTVVLVALARRETTADTERVAWSIALLVLFAGIVPVHHITSYGVIGLLFAVAIAYAVLPGRQAKDGPWLLAVAALLLAAAWLVLEAWQTVDYLRPVVHNAVSDTFDTVFRQTQSRTPFSGPGDASTPVAERAIAFGSVLTLLALVLAGSWIAWLRHRRDPLTVVLAVAALAYLGTLPLRLIPDAWETASRASEFLFLGVALMAGLALSWQLERRPGMWMRCVAAGLVALIICGGIIAGWPSGSRLARPLKISVAGTELLSPSYAAADWTRAELGSGRRIGAEDSDARLLLTRARQTAIEGTHPDIQDVLRSDLLESWMPQLLRQEKIGYVVTDRRRVSSDNILGYFFDVGTPDLWPSGSAAKFDRHDVDRRYDGGDIVVYDVRGLR
jgi:hypothetical protein